MELRTDHRDAVDLLTEPLHLGLGSRARPVDGFSFDPATLQAYAEATAEDGAEGRLVVLIDEDGPGAHWECHPAGDEVLVCVSGRVAVHQAESPGAPARTVVLEAGQAVVNPPGVWHAVDAEGPARLLSITPGLGTEHRAR
ncbi:Cupin domain-containing protein [Pseudonocardia thermophila]|uniref:Cupin domain-containing protein n=1 Tax=Pseudonocardia thermophila TaxID=1848 RepID=A0A1M6WN32_PSETH|nr:cupin domain-containing protein [Pseudonocardia thermophila]SHK95180.1 Cupin domain-containing protein [Pseudonocardia thermophila]